MGDTVRRILLGGLIVAGGWVWGHWGSILFGVVIGLFVARWWRGHTAGQQFSNVQGGVQRPRYEKTEGYGWMRVR